MFTTENLVSGGQKVTGGRAEQVLEAEGPGLCLDHYAGYWAYTTWFGTTGVKGRPALISAY